MPIKNILSELSYKVLETALELNEENPCWEGYKQVGMKDKNGKSVPDCVPIEENHPDEPDHKKHDDRKDEDCGCGHKERKDENEDGGIKFGDDKDLKDLIVIENINVDSLSDDAKMSLKILRMAGLTDKGAEMLIKNRDLEVFRKRYSFNVRPNSRKDVEQIRKMAFTFTPYLQDKHFDDDLVTI